MDFNVIKICLAERITRTFRRHFLTSILLLIFCQNHSRQTFFSYPFKRHFCSGIRAEGPLLIDGLPTRFDPKPSAGYFCAKHFDQDNFRTGMAVTLRPVGGVSRRCLHRLTTGLLALNFAPGGLTYLDQDRCLLNIIHTISYMIFSRTFSLELLPRRLSDHNLFGGFGVNF